MTKPNSSNSNSNSNQEYQVPYRPQPLSEGLEYKDMVGMMKPTIHIDEFSSKMGDDDDVIVASFFMRSKQAADDLASWFEKGYDWVLDADVSPGELKPGRFLVYIEIRRRSQAGKHLAEVISDLDTLTEFEPDQWIMVYHDKEAPFSQVEFEKLVPLSPKEYRKQYESGLNEMRAAAGLDTVQVYERKRDIRQLQAAAGI
jgi:hypothetical protein